MQAPEIPTPQCSEVVAKFIQPSEHARARRATSAETLYKIFLGLMTILTATFSAQALIRGSDSFNSTWCDVDGAPFWKSNRTEVVGLDGTDSKICFQTPSSGSRGDFRASDCQDSRQSFVFLGFGVALYVFLLLNVVIKIKMRSQLVVAHRITERFKEAAGKRFQVSDGDAIDVLQWVLARNALIPADCHVGLSHCLYGVYLRYQLHRTYFLDVVQSQPLEGHRNLPYYLNVKLDQAGEESTMQRWESAMVERDRVGKWRLLCCLQFSALVFILTTSVFFFLATYSWQTKDCFIPHSTTVNCRFQCSNVADVVSSLSHHSALALSLLTAIMFAGVLRTFGNRAALLETFNSRGKSLDRGTYESGVFDHLLTAYNRYTDVLNGKNSDDGDKGCWEWLATCKCGCRQCGKDEGKIVDADASLSNEYERDVVQNYRAFLLWSIVLPIKAIPSGALAELNRVVVGYRVAVAQNMRELASYTSRVRSTDVRFAGLQHQKPYGITRTTEVVFGTAEEASVWTLDEDPELRLLIPIGELGASLRGGHGQLRFPRTLVYKYVVGRFEELIIVWGVSEGMETLQRIREVNSWRAACDLVDDTLAGELRYLLRGNWGVNSGVDNAAVDHAEGDEEFAESAEEKEAHQTYQKWLKHLLNEYPRIPQVQIKRAFHHILNSWEEFRDQSTILNPYAFSSSPPTPLSAVDPDDASSSSPPRFMPDAAGASSSSSPDDPSSQPSNPPPNDDGVDDAAEVGSASSSTPQVQTLPSPPAVISPIPPTIRQDHDQDASSDLGDADGYSQSYDEHSF